MTTRKPCSHGQGRSITATDDAPTLRYQELANAEAVLERSIACAELPRIEALGQLSEPVTASFRFARADGRVSVEAQASAHIALPCQWCNSTVARLLEVSFVALLAADEAEALAWQAHDDEGSDIVVAGETFSAAGLMEDELLLALPVQVCTDEQCPKRPIASYGEAVEEPKPLAGLRALIESGKD